MSEPKALIRPDRGEDAIAIHLVNKDGFEAFAKGKKGVTRAIKEARVRKERTTRDKAILLKGYKKVMKQEGLEPGRGAGRKRARDDEEKQEENDEEQAQAIAAEAPAFLRDARALLDRLQAAMERATATRDAFRARLERDAVAPPVLVAEPAAVDPDLLPTPLRPWFGDRYSTLRWRAVGPGIHLLRAQDEALGAQLLMLRTASGKRLALSKLKSPAWPRVTRTRRASSAWMRTFSSPPSSTWRRAEATPFRKGSQPITRSCKRSTVSRRSPRVRP